MGDKASRGNFFEDFSLDQELVHAAPRTFREGDVALHVALTGSRFALQSSDHFAQALGLERAPVDDLLVFNVVFGKTVADISQNAVANLGYADCRFLAPVYPGDSIRATSAVIGLKENSNGKTGVVHVRSTGLNQRDEPVLEYVRWVMVKKRDPTAPAPSPSPPELPDHVPAAELTLPSGLDFSAYDKALAGSAHLWDDFEPGERIDHVAGVTIEEAEHMMATRLYQNTARVHFDQLAAAESRFGRRIVYGGHVISLARGLSFNGLANACLIAAINAGRHVAPCFAGDTIHAWSEVLDKAALPGRADAGALRLRTIATKDHACEDFPGRDENGAYHAAVVLDLDYWAIVPRARQRNGK